MQLSSLEIFGFKSFADKTKFVFDNGVTGIVGPNGCGKSNIVDSIRWVLGEQKTTALRSEKMENVIFNGTSKRKKANYAQVSLTFENTKNILPTEYTTITVTRKLYRTGESEYLINDVACRLKDIQTLFLDTGIGPDSYAIIELKMVDDILNDKNNARRTLFEEAAGVSRYKIRKKQTLKKLEETQADLERVQDILFEIEKNLKQLESQARKAKRYFELKESYKLFSSRYAWFTIKDLRTEFESVEKEEQDLGDAGNEIQANIAGFEARIQELKKDQLDNEIKLSEIQKELNRHNTHIQEVETEKSVRNERLKFLQQREFSIREQMNSDKEQKERLSKELEELNNLLKEVAVQFQSGESLLATLKEKLDGLKAANDNDKQIAETTLASHRESEQALAAFKREKDIRLIQVEAMGNEIRRNEEDKTSKFTELDSFALNLQSIEQEALVMENEVAAIRTKKEEHEAEIQKQILTIDNQKDSIYRTSRLLDAKMNEYELTKSLVENLEGFPESVKFLKKEANWIKDAPLLSDIFNTDEAFKVAFENLLEPYLNYYVVPSRTDAIQGIRLLANASKGRANFFVLNELAQLPQPQAFTFPGAKPALDLVEFKEEYRKLAEYLLGSVYVVDDENHIPDQVPPDIFFVTRSGTMVRRRFTLGGGSIGLFQGKRLGRAKNLEKLAVEIKDHESELNILRTDLDREERNIAQMKTVNFNRELDEKSNLLQEKRKDLFVLQAREKEYREFITRTGERSDIIVKQIEDLKAEVAALEPQIAEAEQKVQALALVVAETRNKLEESSVKLIQGSEEFNTHQISFIQVKNRYENLSKDISNIEMRILELGESEQKLKTEIEETLGEIHNIVETTLKADEEITALYEVKKQIELHVGEFEQSGAQIRNTITETEDLIRLERNRKDDVEGKRSGIREKITDIKIKLNSLKERMEVEFQVDITSLEESVIFDKPIEEFSAEKAEEDMLKARNKIQNYGEINPMAVEAYNEMKERFDFISGQKKDLEDAKATLLETITEIDRTATEKFNESFNQIRENFIRVFQALFSEGDTCDLVLENPNEPLESDITILAKPKGKRPLTINQLSGGEKTLTAVSLLFSIYLLKPAPFCIFDEVDAPLDDANIDKFNKIVREFSSESQFIIVTHNKRTMVSTNVMYGVTMEEQGISKVLPVDLVALNLN